MKRLLKFFSMTLMTLMPIAFTSCSDDDDITTPAAPPAEEARDTADVTIMMYATFDEGISGGQINDLYGIEVAEASKKVNFTSLVKWGKGYQTKNPQKYGGVHTYTKLVDGQTVTPYTLSTDDQDTQPLTDVNAATKTFTTLKDSVYSTDAGFRMYDGANLTNFINESVKKYPAKHYMLIINNHGNPLDEGDNDDNKEFTRSMLGDSNLDYTSMSIYQLQQGIHNSVLGGGKLTMLYGDVCLVGNIETLYQLRDEAQLVMASASPTIGVDDKYTALYGMFAAMSEDYQEISMALTLAIYTHALTTWWSQVPFDELIDVSVYDMQHVGPVVDATKKVMDCFKTLYTEAKNGKYDLKALKAMQLNYQLPLQAPLQAELFNYNLTLPYGMSYIIGNSEQTVDDYVNNYLRYYELLNQTVDLVQSFKVINDNIFKDQELTAHINELISAIEDFQVLSANSLTAQGKPLPKNDMALIGLNWIPSNYFGAYTTGPSLLTAYQRSDFDKATNWSEFFSTNDLPFGDTLQNDYVDVDALKSFVQKSILNGNQQ